jgi:hypothetical protein
MRRCGFPSVFTAKDSDCDVKLLKIIAIRLLGCWYGSSSREAPSGATGDLLDTVGGLVAFKGSLLHWSNIAR